MYEINIDINNITRYFNKYIDKFWVNINKT